VRASPTIRLVTRRIVAVLCAAVFVAAPASAATPPRSPQGAGCTPAAAKTAILAAPALKSLRAYLAKGAGGGVDSLICHDLTGDGAADMAATIFSGGTAGDIAWVVFRRSHDKWVLALRQFDLYKVGLLRVGADLVDSQPVYRKNDPNCCPTGGFDHRRFHWNGARFLVVRRWHDKRFHP
jgi:hypothetical protein